MLGLEPKSKRDTGPMCGAAVLPKHKRQLQASVCVCVCGQSNKAHMRAQTQTYTHIASVTHSSGLKQEPGAKST